MRSYYVLGMRVDDVTFDESLELIEGFIDSRGCHRVVTPNPEFAMAARRDSDFRRVLNSSSLAIPDGVGLMAAIRLAGGRIRDHVRGTDLVHRIAHLCARKGYRIFLLGGGPGVAEDAADRLRRETPGLQIAGTHAGSSGPQYDQEARAAIRKAGRVDVLLVAYGGGQQEKWIDRNQAMLGIPCALGVGGVFNFLSGRSKRAPEWVRRIELEWLHRLITEPWRWRRQLALPLFALLVLSEMAKGHRPVVEVPFSPYRAFNEKGI